MAQAWREGEPGVALRWRKGGAKFGAKGVTQGGAKGGADSGTRAAQRWPKRKPIELPKGLLSGVLKELSKLDKIGLTVPKMLRKGSTRVAQA